MCLLPVYDCFFCISLSAATKIIGIVYMVYSIGLTGLFSVPIVLAWEALPFSRACFYTGMAVSSATLFVSAVLLVVAAFRVKPSLMRPWILLSWFISIPLMVTCLVGMVTIPLRFVDTESAAEESCVISVYFVHGLLLFYFSCVVNSHRHELKVQKRDKDIEHLMYPTIHNQYRGTL